MNVCVLTHTFPRNRQDVAAAFMHEFSDSISTKGNKVVVVTPFDTEFNRSSDRYKIITYKYIWPEQLHLIGYSKTMEKDVSLRPKAFLLIPFMIFFGTIALYNTVKKEKIDIISVHWILPNGLIAYIVSKLTSVPYVITLPGTDAYLVHRYKIFALVAKFIANSSAAIISNSSWHLRRIMQLGVKDKLTDIISYPVDVSSFTSSNKGVNSLRLKLGLMKNDFVILSVGRLVYKKGFEYLIKAMPSVVKKYPNVKVLIGGDGDLHESLRSLISKLKLQKNVFLLGSINRDEIATYYNLSQVLVAPSIVDAKGNVDGGPVVCYESMACGKAQIVTNVLGVADSIQDGVNGFVVPQKDSKAISNSLVKLIKSKTLVSQMGRANRKLVNQELDSRSIGDKYIKHFNSVLNN